MWKFREIDEYSLGAHTVSLSNVACSQWAGTEKEGGLCPGWVLAGGWKKRTGVQRGSDKHHRRVVMEPDRAVLQQTGDRAAKRGGPVSENMEGSLDGGSP